MVAQSVSLHTGNEIGAEGAAHIAEGMRGCPNMTSLNISSECDMMCVCVYIRLCDVVYH